MSENLPNSPDSPLQFKGKAPPQFFQALEQVRQQDRDRAEEQRMKDPFADVQQREPEKASPAAPPQTCNIPPKAKPQRPVKLSNQPKGGYIEENTKLKDLLAQLKPVYDYDEILLPSRGVFYDGKDGPTEGILHIRPMCGEEEQILATPRFVRRGQAINMIFQRCIKEQFNADNLLSVDRTHLLIWLRGISYGHEYEVKIKCPQCNTEFNHTINLAALMVKHCPEDFGPPLNDVMPKSGFKFTWRLPRGTDELQVQAYRDRMLKEFGDAHSDDSTIYRVAMMLENVEGLSNKTELLTLLKKLPVQDVSYLRTLATEPPFGVDTKCQVSCPMCYHDYEVELPLEAGFFFPKHRKQVEEETNSNSGDT